MAEAEMESSPRSQPKPSDQEEEGQAKGEAKQGGWITLPFIAGSMVGLGLAINGTTSNLQIYLIKEYNVESIDAAQIANIVRGSLNLVPVAGAILSDSYLGCFPVILAGAAINVLSFVLFTLSAALPSLRPPYCPAPSAVCQRGTAGQLAVLYAAVSLLAIGTGGTRFNVATMGADQFGGARDQDTFFNWYFVFLYASFLIGDTAIVYIQDGVSWALGFAICLAATAFSLVLFLLGARYYRMPAPNGSPYSELARVVVAAVRKARVHVGALGPVPYYVGDNAVVDSAGEGAPSKRLSFLNRAAMITATEDPIDDASGGRCASGWRLCRVQQVEDLKSLLGVLPLWSSGIMLSVSIGVMIGMIILQALAMDRSLGPRFKIPAGSITVCSLVAFIAVTPVLDRAVFPLWRRITGMPPSPLQRVGLGHVVNIAGMVVAALGGRRRLSGVHAHGGADAPAGWVTPMSVLWLLLPLGVVGIGEALHFPGNMAFYYLEFPKTLRSLATAMAPLLIAMGFYLSTVFVDVVRHVTAWLPGNVNQARLDNVYWTVAVAVTVNFGYFLICASRYKYQNQSTTVVM
ncbi:putative nitrate excretion transporter 3 [Triticum urartu]|uniref:Putative nitrate excretion transporter 3 n=1 Tax=Triticum urartu TaxID=4572 RepID=M8A1H2_TRIUA|nr:putative nitrate excretion transporter 3 [Triticum urartu]